MPCSPKSPTLGRLVAATGWSNQDSPENFAAKFKQALNGKPDVILPPEWPRVQPLRLHAEAEKAGMRSGAFQRPVVTDARGSEDMCCDLQPAVG